MSHRLISFSEYLNQAIEPVCKTISQNIPEQISLTFSYASDGISHGAKVSRDWSTGVLSHVNMGLTSVIDSTIVTMSQGCATGSGYINTFTATCGEKYEIFVQMIEMIFVYIHNFICTLLHLR